MSDTRAVKAGSPIRAATPTFHGQSFLTKTDSVAEILRGEIVRGDLPPGAPLLQNEVARRFGVSSTPVREAFVVLESEGFVRKRAHHGVLVTERNAADLLDVYEMRMILERHAFRRAIRRVDGALIAELDRLTVEATRSLPDVHECRRLNTLFHTALLRAADSPLFADVLRMLITRSLFAIPLNPASLRRMLGHHRQIVRCLQLGDRAGAERLMDEHLAQMVLMLQAATEAKAPPRRAATLAPRAPRATASPRRRSA